MTDNDPIIMYIIVKKSLNMLADEAAIQVCNCVQTILLHYFKVGLLIHSKKVLCALPKTEVDDYELTTEWMNKASHKSIIKADDDYFEKIKLNFKNCVVIKGSRESSAVLETAIGLKPMHKSEFMKFSNNLKNI